MRSLVPVGVALLGGCAAHSTLRYDRPPDGQPGLPLVAGRVGTEKTTFIIDTGAQISVIDTTLAGAAKLVTVGGPPDVVRAERPQIQLVGWGPVTDRPAAILPLPASFTELGIGAIVSPQWMAPGSGRAAVVDLIHGTIADEAWSSAVRRLESVGPALSGEPVPLCQPKSGGLVGRALVVDTQIDGVAARLELDTGASHTFVIETSTAGQHLAARTSADMTVKVVAGGVTRAIAVERQPGTADADCHTDGRLGMDVLRSCIIVTDGERMIARCTSG